MQCSMPGVPYSRVSNHSPVSFRNRRGWKPGRFPISLFSDEMLIQVSHP